MRRLLMAIFTVAFVFLATGIPIISMAGDVLSYPQRIQTVSRLSTAEQASFIKAEMRAMRPLPALPVPPIMTENGLVQAPNPRPTADFPVVKPQPAVKPVPAIKAPPVPTEKGAVQTPTPRPTPDFPVAKPRPAKKEKPAVEISRQVKPEKRPAVGVVINKTEINVRVLPPAFESGEDKKIATWIRPGELLLMERKYGIWKAETKKTNEVPQGYTLKEGEESGS